MISGTTETVREFERAFAEFVGTRHAVAVANGTVALHAAMVAVGVRPETEVIVPNFTMVAPVFAALYCGAVPVPVEVAEDWNIDPDKVRRAVTSRTSAIVAVHTYGAPAQTTDLQAIAADAGIPLIEDAAEAIGASEAGVMVGSAGTAACYSLYANKTICTGEGGVVTTSDDGVAQSIKSVRNMCFGAGQDDHYFHTDLGFNYRMGGLQAAFGLGQLEHGQTAIQSKVAIGKKYQDRLNGLPGIGFQPTRAACRHVHWAIAIRLLGSARLRRLVQASLRESGVETRRFFTPLHRSGWLAARCRFPQDETYALSTTLHDQGICLPTFVRMEDEAIETVCGALECAIAEAAQVHD